MTQAQPPVESFLGTQIRVVTTFGEEIEGELFCVDISGSNSVVICQRLENGNVNYKWTKTNIIREVTASPGPQAGAGEDWLPHVDLRQVETRSKKLEEEAREDAKRYGVGVTEHAQEVFDALAKTMEAEWDGEDIKVLGVRISKPYDPERNVTGGDAQARERVQKVLQNELGRISSKKQQGK
mmetsp:Transcript_80263/g.213009  ORF Transcript_80263/g.213009 Transcript_80263/m.213009 type:complete len:182 (-) Transcript_80263:57-602(-)|eukprot:CAMPEP_0171188346 /NCGR_PEP_ID=MMETSP0790-20130122/17785_1 /TAXON_ID=2925 /ORGANISM="Alexandrium catenella, Strain OF101" /LENGTH=181 /DNA_ID=CAMNT_0011653427 /DNA_START=78 /DNA_END=623 /DNA_ORIENTATION=-